MISENLDCTRILSMWVLVPQFEVVPPGHLPVVKFQRGGCSHWFEFPHLFTPLFATAGKGEEFNKHGIVAIWRYPMKGEVSQFKATVLDSEALRLKARSAFASEAMSGLSHRYRVVSTASAVEALRERGWIPVEAEEQRVRSALHVGFQKHVIWFRLQSQIDSLDEWNIELVLCNSFDASCAYVIKVGVYRRLCSNGLVVSESGFEAIRFRHAGLEASEVVDASLRVVDSAPRVGARISAFRNTILGARAIEDFSRQALLLRYPSPEEAPIRPEALLTCRRKEDESNDLWTVLNKVEENLIRGGLSDNRIDKRGRLRVMRGLSGMNSKLDLNQKLWGLANATFRNAFAV